MEENYSIVEIFDGPSEAEGHKCGYCKSTNGSLSYGMWAHTLTVKNYQDLIDRGWRRSGKYCYKPTMDQTCCPQYTIRCSISDFKLKKSQKKVLRRMYRFLSIGNELESETNKDGRETEESEEMPCGSIDDEHLKARATIAEKNSEDKKLNESLLKSTNKSDDSPSTSNILIKSAKKDDKVNLKEKYEHPKEMSSSTTDANVAVKKGSGPNPNKPLCKKAKLIRMERKLEKLTKRMEKNLEQQKELKHKESSAKTLRDYVSEPLPPNAAHSLRVRIVRCQPPSKEFLQSYNETYKLYQKYQITIHKDPLERCVSAQFDRFLVISPLEITTVRLTEFHISSDNSYSVYKLYQNYVHNETDSDYDEETYLEFLIHSPLEGVSESSGSRHPGYGSFHQQYWLDDKLIAVGVIDILPNCISSVYFYYDPQYGFLSLGTYGALREIAFAQELMSVTPELRYYYMGFYIHNCVKMRYKGQFQPSFLLCPEVYTWHAIEKARLKLDAKCYSRLEDRRNVEDEDGKVNLDNVMVLHRRTALIYTVYTALKLFRNTEENGEVLEYAKLVGKKCIGRTLLYRK